MTIETVPRDQVARPHTQKVITALAEGPPQQTPIPLLKLSTYGPAEAEIRIHKDGMLIAKCHATGIAPSRLFVAIDPLHYPVNSQMEIEFVNSSGQVAATTRLPATVMSRSIKGIELKLDTDTT